MNDKVRSFTLIHAKLLQVKSGADPKLRFDLKAMVVFLW